MTDIVKRLREECPMHRQAEREARITLYRVLKDAADEIDRLRDENSQLENIFEKMWDADMRAIASWQAANPGNDMVWPDRSKLTLWLLSEIDRLREALNDVLPLAEAGHDAAMAAAGYTGRPWPDEIIAARATLGTKEPGHD